MNDENNTITDPQTVCVECEENINTDEDLCLFIGDSTFCEGCYEDTLGSAAMLLVFDGESWRKYRVTEYGNIDAETGDNVEDLNATQIWVSSDGWRGHHDVHIPGFVELYSGWTTFMTDDTVLRKIRFNDLLGEIENGDFTPPFEMAIALSMTSNVFSTAIGVYAREGNDDEFRSWVDDVIDWLPNALS